MKVIAFNSSPRREKSNTSLILDPFLKGMREAGAEVELFYISKLEIRPCTGCFHCWLKTPGKCVQQDDIQLLIDKVREADIRVYGSPIYCYTFSGPMKNMLDRMVSLASPFVEIAHGRTRHLPAQGEKPFKAVFISNCGLWDMYNFEVAMTHMKMLHRDPPGEFAGALLRPHGQALRQMLKMGAPVQDVVEAAQEAGLQLVKEGKMSPEILAAVSRELMPIETYVSMVNNKFQKVLDRLKQ